MKVIGEQIKAHSPLTHDTLSLGLYELTIFTVSFRNTHHHHHHRRHMSTTWLSLVLFLLHIASYSYGVLPILYCVY